MDSFNFSKFVFSIEGLEVLSWCIISKEVPPLYVIFVSKKGIELSIICSVLRSMFGWYVCLHSSKRISLANSYISICNWVGFVICEKDKEIVDVSEPFTIGYDC